MRLADLHRIGNYDTDKGSVHSYIPIYDQLLAPIRIRATAVLEIGVFHGGSLVMWWEFMPNATIWGVDDERMGPLPPIPEYCNRIRLVKADATDPDLPDKLNGTRFDLIIDDGSHHLDEQLATFKNLSPLLKDGGLYCIEDIQFLDQDRETICRAIQDCRIFDLRSVRGQCDDVLVAHVR